MMNHKKYDRSYAELSRQPIKLLNNRVWRTYTGGKNLDGWQQKTNAQDHHFPECWALSTITASNVGREHIQEGLSKLIYAGEEVSLKEVVESDPAAFLGLRHKRKFGSSLALLVKVLDAAERLTIQVHPNRDFAMRMFSSAFGKTEAWYVLGGRKIDGEDPYLLFGFKPGVTCKQWRQLFKEQDIEGMTAALHRVPLQEGDVYLVEGGVPHAIGKGCFLIEIQEPTDLTLRTERTTPNGKAVPDEACHQGIGFDKMLECFRYEALPFEETMKRWKKSPRLLSENSEGSEKALIDYEDTDKFAMHLLEVKGSYSFDKPCGYCAAIVISGKGTLCWEGGEINFRESESFFLPAGLKNLMFKNTNHELVKIIICYPPN